ncbi:peptide chain release factor-like protein [Verrucomicrobiales bacterium]|jgi:protein subunit release factor B|nr:peptide chain release factor-like protein [Verrucomicrobiales bacterium]
MIEDPILQARLAALGIEEEDLIERFVKGSGPGGQKINKTASCAFLKHVCSGIEVKCQGGRSLQDNRFEARKRLCEALEQKAAARKQSQAQKRAKTRFQKRKRSPRQKAKIVESKRKRGQTKQLRKRPAKDD